MGGGCECSPGWKGPHCEELDLLPAPGSGAAFAAGTSGLNQLNPAQNWTSTWGGSVVAADDGTYHMFAAQMRYSCGINAWLQNSVVVHGTASSATGEYTVTDTVAGLFSHEPVVTRAPTGEYVLFYTSTVQFGKTPTICNTCTDCARGNSSMDCPPDWDAKGRDWTVPLPTYMIFTTNPNSGAWSTPVQIPSANLNISESVDTNFAALIMSNGSLVGVSRNRAVVFAEHWRDPSSYRYIATAAVQGWGEDPSIHQDASGNFHIITHAECGKHFFSPDAYHWSTAPSGEHTCAYPKNVTFADGKTFTFGRRERPHLVFAAGGHTPLALTSAVTAVPTSSTGHPKKLLRWPDASYTLLQPINQRDGRS